MGRWGPAASLPLLLAAGGLLWLLSAPGVSERVCDDGDRCGSGPSPRPQGEEGREGEARWLHRRLAKGEPSGEEGEAEEGTGRTIKISVTPGPRGGARAEEPEGRAAQLAEYRARKLRVSSVCRRLGLGRFRGEGGEEGEEGEVYRQMYRAFPWPPEKSLMWQEPWHLLYCWMHKVASTSWSKVFLQLAGQEVPLSRTHEATQRFAPRPTQLPTALSTSLVFTIVRHPFERLVSAYRDKIELARKYAYVYTRHAPRMAPGGQRPTFVQFVDYLLREPVEKYNDHWVPYWLHCHLCEMEYDVIGKMETLSEDMAFIAETSGLATTNISLPWANRRAEGSQDPAGLHYFRRIGPERTRRLYAIYRPDFEMFGYSAQPYFSLFGQDSP